MVELFHVGEFIPHVASWEMLAKILLRTEPNAPEHRLVSGSGDHLETTSCDVFGIREPEVRHFREFLFVERRLDIGRCNMYEGIFDFGIAPCMALQEPCQPPNIGDKSFLGISVPPYAGAVSNNMHVVRVVYLVSFPG